MKRNIFFIFSLFFIGIGAGKAQYTVLYNFNGSIGGYPYGSLTLAGNMFYGLTYSGGGSGTIFSINTDGNGYKNMFNFGNSSGAYPYGNLTLSGNLLYGMTFYGGANDSGCIFSIDTNGNSSNCKDIFDFNGTNGKTPLASLTLSGNLLYGMTPSGGLYHDGVIFSLNTNDNVYKVLLNFNGSDGNNPQGSLCLSGDKLYGMTYSGGSYNDGIIFSIDTNGNEYKDLLNFNGTNGSNPQGSLLLVGSKLYGLTSAGGSYNDGIVFWIDTNGNTYKNIFNFNGTNGSDPRDGLLTLSVTGDTLFGATDDGGANSGGVLFSLDTTGNGYNDIFDFNCKTGCRCNGPFILLGGKLCGMAWGGGAYGYGVIFNCNTNNNITTSINEVAVSSPSIALYPNPSGGIFNIICNASDITGSPSIIKVYNVLGEQVLIETLHSTQDDNLIDLSSQPSGVYLYRLTADNGELMGEGKLVFQK